MGFGGHARVLIDCLRSIGREILFCTEIDPKHVGRTVDGVEIKGSDELILNLEPDSFQLVNGIGSIGKPVRRQQIYECFSDQGFEFATVIHPSAVIATSAKIADGVQIMAGALIQADATIGCNTIINSGTSIDHECRVGSHCHIAPRVALSGEVTVGDSSHIGTGASIIQSICVGNGCVLGAGATLVSDLPDDTIAVGTPAKPVSSSRKKKQ